MKRAANQKFCQNGRNLKLTWNWSRHRDLNSGPLPYHGSALPLSYDGVSVILTDGSQIINLV